MDQPPLKRRFQFGLRTLLLLIASSTIGVQVYVSQFLDLERQASHVKFGMPREKVREILGTPWYARTRPHHSCPEEIYIEDGRMWKDDVLVSIQYNGGQVWRVTTRRY